MAPRPSHIPHNIERTALQLLSSTGVALPILKLHPASRRTIAGMLDKGWIEKQTHAHDGARFVITPAGKVALKAKIPTQK